MKILIIYIALILLTTTSIININAASLKNLSEQLSSTKDDNTKEKIPDEADEAIDESVNELDKLKNHVSEENVNELDGLKSHRDNALNLIQLTEEYFNNKGFRLASGQEHPSEAPTTAKAKEILENLPQGVGASEATTASSTKRLSLRSDLTFNPSTILRHHNGKYSAYDMAQYIFWTGDEEGVAKAVEELIDEGLMSRENAIEFLNDIRVGIEYLESIYSLKESDSKINTPLISRFTPAVRTTVQSTIDELPFNYNYNYQKFHSLFKASNKDKINREEDEAPTLSPVAIKALEKIPALMKLTDSHRETHHAKQDALNDETGRNRLAEFISGEYSLEEVIYQLAKTMFEQSLKHASNESQNALQKLTEFIESEGKHGRISPALQKKILDVLLAALSDTLSENPEIMEKARHAMTTRK